MASSGKTRLDVLLVELGLAQSRHRAQALILSGQVLVDNVPVDKAGTSVRQDSEIRVRGEGLRFVSRGGDKLEGALKSFEIDVEGRVCLDIGSSTGGFTDCLLQNGARLVYAVDVGTNQLAYKLRIDPRVRVHEGVHVNQLSAEMFDERPEIVTADLSFIGVRKVLPSVVKALANCEYKLVILVKPQFELEPSAIGKGGVVKSESEQLRAVELVKTEGERLGLKYVGQVASTVRGAKSGNQEYFIYSLYTATTKDIPKV